MSRTDIDFKIGADLKQFRGAMGNIDHSLKKLSGGFGALGGVIGASFAIDIIQQFAAESIELASKMEGVEAAFNRLNDPNLLDNLRKATAGTVDDLTLMQTAVKAENFRIPMDVLAKGLDFAQRRAQATGESVDYMVESFVTGLGRQSIKILDNLGISAAELRERMAEGATMAEAVGAIMDEEFKKVGERVTTTSMKVDQQRASITNLKTEVGDKLLPVYSAFLDNTIKGLGKINFILDDQEKGYKRLFVAVQSYFNITKFGLDLVTNPTKALLSLLGETEEEVKEMNAEFTNGLPKIEDWKNKVQQWVPLQKDLNKATDESTEATDEFSEAIERTRNEAHFYTETIHRLKQAHSMLGKAQEAAFQPMMMTLQQYREFSNELLRSQALEKGLDLTYDLEAATFDAVTAFNELGSTIGNVLTASFNAALTSGESFFKVFADGLKAMLAQLAATIAAALVLSVVMAAVLGGGLGALSMQSIGTAFKHFGGPSMGVPSFGINGGLGGAMQGIEIFGRLSGSDILLSGERAGRNRNRLSGIGG